VAVYLWKREKKPRLQVLENVWITGTKISLTNFSLQQELNFQTGEAKERLKLVLRLKFASRGWGS
jgi:hypothetical protein